MQICGFGWFYDAYYTHHMVNFPKMVSSHVPFYVKIFDNKHPGVSLWSAIFLFWRNRYDYLPVNTDEDLEAAIAVANLQTDKTMRLMILQKRREDYSYHMLFFSSLSLMP